MFLALDETLVVMFINYGPFGPLRKQLFSTRVRVSRPNILSHESLNCFAKNSVDLSIIVAGQFPTERLLHCVKLTGISGAPKSGHSFSPVKNPTDRESKQNVVFDLALKAVAARLGTM